MIGDAIYYCVIEEPDEVDSDDRATFPDVYVVREVDPVAVTGVEDVTFSDDGTGIALVDEDEEEEDVSD
jgi:hypothetical protein